MNRQFDGNEEAELFLQSEPSDGGKVKIVIAERKAAPGNGFTAGENAAEGGGASAAKSAWRGIYTQCLVAGAVFLLTTGSGMPVGYSAVLLPQLQGENSTLPTDREMGSWIASVHSASTPLGSFLSGLIADRFGRKNALRISILPVTIGWICIALADSHWLILMGRVIIGVAVGLSGVPSQVMLGEIAVPQIRGILMGSICVAFSLGILVIYGLGAVEWHIAAGVSTVFPLCSLIAFTLLPESPIWLLRQERTDEASKALFWLRGGPSIAAKTELKILTAHIEREKQLQEDTQEGCWTLFTKSAVLKPFLIVNTYGLLQVVAGTFLMIFYAVDLVARADEGGVDSFVFAIITAAIRFTFSIIASGLLFFMGRRPLGISTGVISSLSAFAVGVVIYIKKQDPEYFEPLTATVLIVGLLCLFMATNTCGSFVLPGVTIGELLPGKARGVLGGWIFTTFSLGVFASAKLYPFLIRTIGVDGLFFVFGAGSLLSTIFVFLLLPESKGRTLNEIEDYFKESNILWLRRDTKKYP